MARSVRGSSAAAAGRGDRFSSAPPDYRILLPTLPSGESMQQCVFLHGDLAKRPYRLEDFREPLEEAGIIKNITGIGAFQMNHIWLVKLRTKADKDALLKTGGLQVKGGFCAVIDPIQQDVTVKVHWVDFAVQNESFRQVLSNFGDVLEVSNDNWSVAGFEHATSTTRVVRMRLKEGVVLDDLPHLFKLGSGTVLLVAPVTLSSAVGVEEFTSGFVSVTSVAFDAKSLYADDMDDGAVDSSSFSSSVSSVLLEFV
ncbi:hypothetical protein HPB49_019511 [Dermacentor silvarum]|uniref:Uncharacterized protein n=1 Tax=Dermacentor silvarum TaxID=543639 RepID=A0ACB8DFM4_DERSI|nr:hypothetical protein HPB49_019511 [Dermacentor silvarum]